MDNFNRTISFILGLVVVVVFLAVISGRIDLRGRLLNATKGINLLSSNKTTPTPTPTPKNIISSVTVAPQVNTNYQTNKPIVQPTKTNQTQITQNNYSQNPKTIPNTGSPTLLLPLAFSALMMGIGMRRKSN